MAVVAVVSNLIRFDRLGLVGASGRVMVSVSFDPESKRVTDGWYGLVRAVSFRERDAAVFLSMMLNVIKSRQGLSEFGLKSA